jgi:hypothetical protein
MPNELMNWVGDQEHSQGYARENLTRVISPDPNPEIIVPSFWKSPSLNKAIAIELPATYSPEGEHNPSRSTILGGMCLLTTIDMKRIARKELTFESVNEFNMWFSSWYPRIDQIHDAVGIPPKNVKEVMYVSEDSFFAHRLASYTGLDKSSLQSVLRSTHESQGQPIVEKYFRNQGFKGEVSTVYTSEIESELDLALSMWERMLGKKFQKGDRNFAKVELMYTGFWLDILKIRDSAVIFEAANKMILKGYLRLEDWFREERYGTGINRNLGIAGFLPFLTTKGDSSLLTFEEVPNYSNFQTYQIPDEDMPWYITNLLFNKRKVIENGPLILQNAEAADMIKNDLTQYYE